MLPQAGSGTGGAKASRQNDSPAGAQSVIVIGDPGGVLFNGAISV